MELSERIERIKPFFVSFNVVAEESAAYTVVKFPNGWTIPDQTALKDNFKIELAPIQNGICFVTEIGNGTEKLFDAIDYVIDFNKKVEERKGLLLERVKELQNLFATETLDKLKTLKFVFEPQKKGTKKTAAKKAEPQKTLINEKPSEKPIDTPAEIYDAVSNTGSVSGVEQKEESKINESSLFGLAKSIAGE